MIADLNQLVAKCQIFISYKRSTGEELAYLLYEKLTASGYHVFFDSKGLIDENYKKAIEKKIQECTDFIVLLTAHSMDGLIDEKEEDINTEKEDWLAKEIRMAIKNNKHIIPIIKGDYTIPTRISKDISDAVSENGVYFPKTYFEEAFARLSTVYLNSKLDDKDMESDTSTLKGYKANEPCLSNDFALKTEIGAATVQENKAGCVKIYEDAIRAGSKAAYYNLGDIYEKCADDMHLLSEEEYGIKIPSNIPNIEYKEYLMEQAQKYYLKAENYPPALYRLGVMCEKKYALDKAIEYYLESQKSNFAPAVNAVAYYYENGLGGLKRDTLKAMELFKLAMDLGLSQAAYNYAKLRQRNMLPHERNEIINLYLSAFFSETPIPQAAYEIGRLFEDISDKVNALHYYYLAAEAGFIPANAEIKRLKKKNITSR